MAMTGVGRTVRENGTGGVMVLAEADLYDRRDLMPTQDVRASAAWVMGLDWAVLEQRFPGPADGRGSRGFAVIALSGP